MVWPRRSRGDAGVFQHDRYRAAAAAGQHAIDKAQDIRTLHGARVRGVNQRVGAEVRHRSHCCGGDDPVRSREAVSVVTSSVAPAAIQESRSSSR